MPDEVSAEILAAGRGYEALFVPALFTPWTDPVTTCASVQKYVAETVEAVFPTSAHIVTATR